MAPALDPTDERGGETGRFLLVPRPRPSSTLRPNGFFGETSTHCARVRSKT